MSHILNGRRVTQEEWDEHTRTRCQGRLQDMLRSRTPPMANTDREFLAGHCNGNQFEGQDVLADQYRQMAHQGGVDVTGKVYLSGLARFPGDPEAWVNGKGDAQKVLEARGWGASGLIKREVTNVAQPLNHAVDPQIIKDEVEDIIEQVVPEGENLQVDRLDLAEQVFNKRKGVHAKEQFDPVKLGLTDEVKE